jgi:RimJ/RimL family protein N-acetyltransferase
MRHMTTAYGGEPGDGKAGLSSLDWLPYRTKLPGCGRKVEVAPFQESEWQVGMDLMNLIIREGKSWPFEEEFETIEDYRGYFLSHAAFVVRGVEPGLDAAGRMSKPGSVLGTFYCKPNYPGRCRHICNGGFITNPDYRRMGVAKVMGQVFLRAARDLGYQSSYFNLVFKSNEASVALWESLGFERVAILEKAARLEGEEGLDTAYGYRFDLESLEDDYLIDNDK